MDKFDNLMRAQGQCTACFQSGEFWFRIDGTPTYHARCGGTLQLTPAKPAARQRCNCGPADTCALCRDEAITSGGLDALLCSPDLGKFVAAAQAGLDHVQDHSAKALESLIATTCTTPFRCRDGHRPGCPLYVPVTWAGGVPDNKPPKPALVLHVQLGKHTGMPYWCVLPRGVDIKDVGQWQVTDEAAMAKAKRCMAAGLPVR